MKVLFIVLPVPQQIVLVKNLICRWPIMKKQTKNPGRKCKKYLIKYSANNQQKALKAGLNSTRGTAAEFYLLFINNKLFESKIIS